MNFRKRIELFRIERDFSILGTMLDDILLTSLHQVLEDFYVREKSQPTVSTVGEQSPAFPVMVLTVYLFASGSYL
jgi:hypothetical protein